MQFYMYYQFKYKLNVVLPIGYRSEDDKYAKYPKVRFDRDEIVEIIK